MFEVEEKEKIFDYIIFEEKKISETITQMREI